MRVHFLIVSLFLAIDLIPVRGQLLKEDLSPELRYLFEGDYDTWEAPAEIQKNYPYYLSGFDDEGRPIWVVEIGKWDIKAAVDKGEEWEKIFNKYCNQWLFRVIKSTGLKSTPDNIVKEAITIHDYEGFSLDQLNSARALSFQVNQVRQLVLAMKFLYKGYIINMNFFAENLFKLLKPVFGSEFYRLEIFGTNKDKWLAQLKRNVPRESLPEWYGGEKNHTAVKVYG